MTKLKTKTNLLHFSVKRYLEPLAIATNVTQAASTRPDHVLLTFANLRRLYGVEDIDADVSVCILGSIEKRWATCDQNVFILAVFLKPFIRDALFGSHQAVSRSGILSMLHRVFSSFYPKLGNANAGFSTAVLQYMERTDNFADRQMLSLYDGKAASTAASVSILLHVLCLYSFACKRDADLIQIWKFAKLRTEADKENQPENGHNGLCNVAIRILSIVPNSAGAERLFSLFGIIHTKLRNRLGHEKVDKIARLKMELQRENC